MYSLFPPLYINVFLRKRMYDVMLVSNWFLHVHMCLFQIHCKLQLVCRMTLKYYLICTRLLLFELHLKEINNCIQRTKRPKAGTEIPHVQR